MEVLSSVLSGLFQDFQGALYGGIRPDVPGHGGEECTNYLDRRLMLLDTGIGEGYNIQYSITWHRICLDF